MNETLKTVLIGMAVGNILMAGAKIAYHYVNENRNATESRGYVVPERFETKSADVDLDGNLETIANYSGTNYLFKLGTNGIPYCQPYSIK